jgi:hypothetical protein
MKTTIKLVAVLGMLSAATAFAKANNADKKIPKGGIGAYYTSGLVEARDVPCPVDAQCFAPQTNVKLTLGLGGCKDTLGTVDIVRADNDLGKLELYVAATRIANKKSWATDCRKAPTAVYETSYPYAADKVIVHFMGADVAPVEVDVAPSPAE